MLYILFILACAAVVIGGIKLTEYGDQLEDTVGLSAGFIGVFLLAATTSLPEFVASFSAVYYVKAPQLALGNVFGSNTFNLVILAVLDLFFIKEVLYHKVHNGIARTIAIGQMMTGLALAGIYLSDSTFTVQLQSSAGNPLVLFNWFSLALLVAYCFCFKAATAHESDDDEDEGDSENQATAKEKRAVIAKFAFWAAWVVVSGVILTEQCDKVAEATGLGKTFIGSIMLAFATSLPEATVCVTALKIKSYDLIFGNVLGSNIFNLLVLSLTDLFTPHIAMLQVEFVSLNYITGLGAFIMSGLVLLAIFHNTSAKKLKALSAVMICIYVLSFYIMFIQQQKLLDTAVNNQHNIQETTQVIQK
jgi:cation:H+ antiporter